MNGTPYTRADGGREGSWSYDGDSLTARIVVPAQAASQPLTVDVTFPANAASFDGLLYRMKRTASAISWLKSQWQPPAPLPDDLSLSGQLGLLIEYHPEQLGQLVQQFDQNMVTLAAQVNQSHATPEVKAEFARRVERIRQP